MNKAISLTFRALTICILIILSLTACTGQAAPTLTPTLLPTNTPRPSATLLPSKTPTIAPTASRTATPTRVPTDTSEPTKPTTTPTQDTRGVFFDSEWLQFYYPEDWKITETGEQSDCTLEDRDCGLVLYHSASEDVTISFSRWSLEGMISMYKLNLEGDDQKYWQSLELLAIVNNVKDHLKLVSRTRMQVGGLPAIKRIYEQPLLDSSNNFESIMYIYRVFAIKDQDHYYFTMESKNEDELNQYQSVFDQILDTVVFPQ